MRSFVHKAAIALTFLAAFLLPSIASADTLYFSPSTGSYGPGRTFSVRVFVSSTAQSVNAVSGVVGFPQDKLQVVSVSKADSIVNLWVQDPSYSNSQGTVTFEGVIPNPGFQGPAGDIVTIIFKAVGQGDAALKFNSGSVLANDGNGTNILKNIGSAAFSLGSAPVPAEPAPAPESDIDPLAPHAPVITSSSYPDSKIWYTDTTGKFNWKLPEDVTAVKVLLGKMPSSKPTVVYDPPIDSKEIPDIDDGAWYLHVQFKNSHGWGAIAHYLFKVDSTKPDNFSIKEIQSNDTTDPRPKFSFQATDVISGIDHYTVAVDSRDPETWTDTGSGVYQIPTTGPGKHTLVARAYDEAGNYAVSSIDFMIAPLETPRIETYTEKVTKDSPLTVTGTAISNATVRLSLSKAGADPIAVSVKSDADGKFSALFDKEIPSGAYRLTAVAEDSRGALSDPSAEKAVLVSAPWLSAIGSGLISIFAIAVPIFALVVVLLVIVFWGIRKIGNFRRGVRKELREVESTIERAFALFKEDLEDSIRILERAKTRRALTKEEDAIISRFRQNLDDAEKVIRKEIHDVEREIGDR